MKAFKGGSIRLTFALAIVEHLCENMVILPLWNQWLYRRLCMSLGSRGLLHLLHLLHHGHHGQHRIDLVLHLVKLVGGMLHGGPGRWL